MNSSESSAFVFKCCSGYNESSILCSSQNNDREFSDSLAKIKADGVSVGSFDWSYFRRDCEKYEIESPWEIFSDGTLWDGEMNITNSEYCLESNLSVLTPYVCFEEENSVVVNSELQDTLYPIGMLVSLPFFVINLLVYTLLYELRRTAHGKAFIFLQGSMIVAYGVLVFTIFASKTSSFDMGFTACSALGKPL